MPATVNAADLNGDQLDSLGIKPIRKVRSFSAEEVRSWALKCLAPLAGLKRAERERVLRHALKVNRV